MPNRKHHKKIRLKSDLDEALQKSNGNEVLVTVKRNDDIKEITKLIKEKNPQLKFPLGI